MLLTELGFFVCLFLVASSQPCSFPVSLLRVSLGKSLLVLLAKTGWGPLSDYLCLFINIRILGLAFYTQIQTPVTSTHVEDSTI